MPKDFNSITMLAEVFKFVYLFQTVVKVDGFVRPVVYEFYANLVPELIREGKSYVRGRLYAFNLEVINEFFVHLIVLITLLRIWML